MIKALQEFIMLFKKPIFIFIGACFILRILYLRVFKQRISYGLLQNLSENQQYFQILIYGLMICFFTYLIMINLAKNLKKKENDPIKLFDSALKLISNSLVSLNKFILEKTFISNYIGQWLENLGLYLYKNFDTDIKKISILAFGYIIPKTIVAICFFVDVFIYNEFNYTFKTSILLLVPLIMNYLHYLLHYFCEGNSKVMDNVLLIKNIITNDRITAMDMAWSYFVIEKKTDTKFVSIELTEDFKNSHKNETYSTKATIAHHETFLRTIFIRIKYFEICFDEFCKKKILPVFNIILYTNYLLCWSYILYFSW